MELSPRPRDIYLCYWSFNLLSTYREKVTLKMHFLNCIYVTIYFIFYQKSQVV